MIYVRGDPHGIMSEFTDEKTPGISAWTNKDVLLIPGDFGFVLRGEENDPHEKENLDTLSQFPFTIAFIDGNHEGFPYLCQYPEVIQFGAPVRQLRNNIFWLQRGFVYTIQGHTFFVMGGAHSMDKSQRVAFREFYGFPIWFKEELPSPQEYRRAILSLAEHNHKVDFILTHTAPKSIIHRVIGEAPDMHDAELTGFLDWIYHDVRFSRWFFGHFHVDMTINERMVACFRDIHEIPPASTPTALNACCPGQFI